MRLILCKKILRPKVTIPKFNILKLSSFVEHQRPGNMFKKHRAENLDRNVSFKLIKKLGTVNRNSVLSDY